MTPVLPQLRDGRLDFPIVANSGDVPPTEFAQEPVRMAPQRIVARQGHPLAAATRLAQLARCEWVLAGAATGSEPDRAVADLAHMFKSAKTPAPTLVTRGHAMAAIALVRQSDAISVFPKGVLDQPEGHGIEAPNITDVVVPTLHFVQLALRDVPLTPPAAWFARCLRDACAGVVTASGNLPP